MPPGRIKRRDEVAAIYALALKANTPVPQVGYLAIACLSIVMKDSKQMIWEWPFHKAQSHNHHGFQIHFYLFDLVAHFTALEISSLPALKWRSFEFLSWSRHSETRHSDLGHAVCKGRALPPSNQHCPFLQPAESQIQTPRSLDVLWSLYIYKLLPENNLCSLLPCTLFSIKPCLRILSKMGFNILTKLLICSVIYYPIHPCIFFRTSWQRFRNKPKTFPRKTEEM